MNRKNVMAKILGYKPAKLYSTGQRAYVAYFLLNPATQKFERQRIYISVHLAPKERTRYISDMIQKINEKLREGWNPMLEDESSMMFKRFIEVLDETYEYKKTYIRKRSSHQYESRVNLIKDWLKMTGKEKIFAYEFDEKMARDLMRYLITVRKERKNKKEVKISGVTYNNYIIDFRSFFNDMVKKGYIKNNPFKVIEKMPEQSKFKQPFDREQSEIYVDYLKENDYDFFIISGYTYYCALRPNETVQLRVKNVNFEKQYIEVPAEVAKNRKQRRIPIADEFLKELEPYLKKFPSEYYLCSTDMRPGKNKIYPTRIAGHFREVAERIGLPKEIFFYSLKDTCAERLMEAGYSAQDIRDLFGHSSIAVTDSYLKRRNAYQNVRLKKNFPKL